MGYSGIKIPKTIIIEERPKWVEGYEPCSHVYSGNTKVKESTYQRFTYPNGGFIVKLLKAASNNSQHRGKYACWECQVTCPDGKKFKIEINSDLLCDALLANTWVDGECFSHYIYFGWGTGNRLGIFTPNMQGFEAFSLDEKLRGDIR